MSAAAWRCESLTDVEVQGGVRGNDASRALGAVCVPVAASVKDLSGTFSTHEAAACLHLQGSKRHTIGGYIIGLRCVRTLCSVSRSERRHPEGQQQVRTERQAADALRVPDRGTRPRRYERPGREAGAHSGGQTSLTFWPRDI